MPQVDSLDRAIAAALTRTAVLEGKHITVTSDATGVVTLTGTVRSWPERDEVERTAWSAPRASRVVNDLRVEPWPSPGSAQL